MVSIVDRPRQMAGIGIVRPIDYIMDSWREGGKGNMWISDRISIGGIETQRTVTGLGGGQVFTS